MGTPLPPPSSTPTGPDVIAPPASPSDPVLILILALFLGGIAYFVIGQWQKGIAALAAWFALLMLAVVTCGFGALLFVPAQIAIVVDAYMQANLLKQGRPVRQWTFFSTGA